MIDAEIVDTLLSDFRSALAGAKTRDPGEHDPVYYPGDFGLHRHAASVVDDLTTVDAIVKQEGSQKAAAAVLGCSQATLSRAARRWSPVWDGSAGPISMLALILMVEMIPCRKSALLAIPCPDPDNDSQWSMHLESGFDLGLISSILIRGDDGLIHPGHARLPKLENLRKDLTWTRSGGGLCPKDRDHGVTVGKYCRVCRARIRKDRAPGPEALGFGRWKISRDGWLPEPFPLEERFSNMLHAALRIAKTRKAS